MRAPRRSPAPMGEPCLPPDGAGASGGLDCLLRPAEPPVPCAPAALAGSGRAPEERRAEGGGIAHTERAIGQLGAECRGAAIVYCLRYGGGARWAAMNSPP